MKYWLTILLILVLYHAKGQCLSGKALWDSIVVLRQSDVADSVQLRQMHSFLQKSTVCGYDKDSVYILLLQRTGALYSYQSDLPQAISYTWQAVNRYNTFTANKSITPALQVKNFFNLYLYYEQTGDDQNVSKVVDSCILLSVYTGYADKYTLDALDEKSTTQLEAGDYHGCIKTTRLADLLKKGTPANHSIEEREKMIRLFSTRLNAMIFLQQYEAAEALLQGRREEYLQLNNGNRMGNWYALMGKLRRRQHRYKETIELLKSSVNSHLKAGYPEGVAESLNNIGFVYLDNLHEYTKALPYFQQALHYASGVETLNIQANIGNTYVRLSSFPAAFAAFQRAFDQVSTGMNEVKLLSSKDFSVTANYAEYLLRLEMYKGDAYLAYYNETGTHSALNHAIEVYKCADHFLNKMKALQSDFDSKLFWRSDARLLYEHGIEAARLANDLPTALYFFEKSRAVLLTDQIQLRKLLTRDEFAQYSAVRAAISGLESTPAINTATSAAAQKKLFTYRLQLGNIEQQIRERRLMDDKAVVTVAEIHNNILDRHHLFLETYTGDTAVYILAITKEKSVLNKIGRAEYDSVLKMYTGYLANHTSLNRNFDHFTEISYRLYSLLFKELKPMPGRMVISPDGILFPFEALVCSRKGASVKYLIEVHPISYTYNARYFINGRDENNKQLPTQFTGFAPVYYPVNTNLTPLVGSKQSMDHIGSNFELSAIYTLAAANRATFIKKYSKSGMILLYTHGAFKRDKNEPVIFFSDSALYLSELAGEQKPQTRLIVLAACETGVGSNFEGEGVFSFSRGFAAMGIPSSVTTLWSVDKAATFRITELFYKFIAEGNPTDIALQKAKLEFMAGDRKASLPYYWAAPVLIGNTDPLMSPEKDQNIWLLLSILATAFVVFIAVRHLKKRD